MSAPKKLTTFDASLDHISRCHVEFHIDARGRIRMTEEMPEEWWPELTQCPLQAVAECFGYKPTQRLYTDRLPRIPSWQEVLEDTPDGEAVKWHIVNLADRQEYRAQHPEDARLLLLACGLRTR